MADTKTYDASQLKVIVGVTAVTGFEEGDFLVVARDEQNFTKQVGATGEVSRSKTNNKSGTITIRTKQTSPVNAELSAVMLLDEIANGGIVPIIVMDLSGNDVHNAAECWLQQTPDGSYGRDAAGREWIFDAASVDMFFGGNN